MREKLIELIMDSGKVSGFAGGLADHLIANGVRLEGKQATSDETSKWIPVRKRLPIEEAKAHEQEWCKEYCEFLVMIERGLLPTTLYYDWEENEWFWINTALERETYKVTHWMPMPQPPKGERLCQRMSFAKNATIL